MPVQNEPGAVGFHSGELAVQRQAGVEAQAARLAPMVAHFSAHQKLSKKEIAELKRLVEKLDHE